MKKLNTKLFKIGDNEYRIDDKFTITYSDGRTINYDYGLDYNNWVNNVDNYKTDNPFAWEKIIINEFDICGLKPIIIWTKDNDFFGGYYSTDPLCNFGEDYNQLSENRYANLLLNLFEAEIIDKNVVEEMDKYSRHYDPTKIENVRDYLKDNDTIPIEIYRYGFQNRIIIFVKSKHFDINKIPEHEKYIYKNLKL